MPIATQSILKAKPASPLSAAELRRLLWFKGKMAATVFLDERGEYVSRQQAARLSFLNWLVCTRRVSS